jgi:ferrous iron transport protein B
LVQRLLLDVGGAHSSELSQVPKLSELGQRLARSRQKLQEHGQKVPAIETKVRYGWIRNQLEGIYQRLEQGRDTLSDRIDRWLTHRVWGLVFFALMMFAIYQAITHGADLVAGQIDESLIPFFVTQVESVLEPGMLRSLITDGVIAGVGSVIVFLPIILLLFFFIAILEDCGYMARAAFVMDKVMSYLGLSGKSFLPLMSSFACAVPGIMATRVIESWRDRMVTILIAPLMSCSARLPVYMLMITAFVPSTTGLGGWIGLQGVVLFLMSSLGLIVAIPVAWLLKRFWFQGEPSAFVMELPSYKLPSLRVVFFRVWERAQAFIGRAGSLIFCTAVLVWAAGYFPGDHTRQHELTGQIEAWQGDQADPQLQELEQERRQLSGRLIESSLLGRVGKAIEPAVKPLGWDWRIGVGVLASFPAREVIIATLGTIYSLGGEVGEDDPGLQAALHASRWPDGRPVFNLPVALSIMVFFALCAQCAATLMVIRRETNSWRWPVFTFGYMTLLAYLAALATYQVGSLF